jgi:hypothetical protein
MFNRNLGGCIMLGDYLSGTGNTKHCIEKLLS